MKKSIIVALMAGFTSLTVALSANSAELGDVNEPIKLAINEWDGQHISTHVGGSMLKEAGYKVEYVTAGYQNMYQAMADGNLHAALEIWDSNVSDLYGKMLEQGGVVELDALGLDAGEGIAYPAHVASICPGLPKWEALKDCADKFATAETIPQGRLIDYPADWGTPGADIMKGMQLPFKAVPAGSEGALVTEIRASVEKKGPLLITFWQPHWAIAKYDMKFVALPPGEPACREDPSWGSNPNATGDCDFNPTRIFKAGWSGMKDKWPAAYEILKNYKLAADHQGPMLVEMNDGGKVEDVVAKWMKNNKSAWKPVVDNATK